MKRNSFFRPTRFISALLILLMLFSVMPLTIFANPSENTTDYAGGNGTAEKPYLISDIKHLINIGKNLNAYYEMTADIIIPDSYYDEGGLLYNEGMGWLPIEGEFTGHFNGKGHAVRNLYFGIAYNGTSFSGLFGLNKGIIANLTVDVFFETEGLTSGENYYTSLGGIAGFNDENALIVNCVTEGYLSAYGDNLVITGGIAGFNYGTIRGCMNKADIDSLTYNYYAATGGIAGFNYNQVDHCENIGFINGCSYYAAAIAYTGGIVGISGSGNIYNSANKASSYSNYGGGDVFASGLAITGGIAGISEAALIIGCYNTGTIRGESKESGCISGGIVGMYSSGSLSESYNAGSVTNLSGYSKNLVSGGIAGVANSIICNVYNEGTVSGAYITGGIAGALANTGEVVLGYTVGGVGIIYDGTPTYLGAIVGYNEGGTVRVFYFMNTTAAGSNAVGYGEKGNNLVELTWEQMKYQSTMPSLDFTHTWTMNGMDGVIHPKLRRSDYAAIRSSISVETLPAKTQYDIGESLDLTGLTVKLNYANSVSVPLQGYVVRGFDSSKEGKVTVTVEYDYLETSFEVNVVSPILTGIRIHQLPSRVNYPLGMALTTDGMILNGIYNGTTENVVTDFTVTGYDKDKLGKQTLTVTCEGFTAQYEVTVFDPTVNELKGDTDANLTVNADDAIYLLYSVLFGEEYYKLYQECDFDGSGVKDADDAIYLLYSVLFGEVYYPLH